jgi:hypothetical protein
MRDLRRPRGVGKMWRLGLVVVALLIVVAPVVTGGSEAPASALASSDQFAQQAKLTSGEAGAKDWFGREVALSADGDTALIGAPHANGGAGAVWVFTRTGSTWTEQAQLTGGAEEVGEGHFGHGLAIAADGETAMIGAPTDNGGVGAVWVFTRSGSTWTQQGAKLTGEDESGPGRFGTSLALSDEGDTAVIGAPDNAEDRGAVWVFTRSGSTWTQQGEALVGGEESGGAEFGRSVALSGEGETALVGGPYDGNGAGAVWVFTRSGSSWAQQGAKLTGAEEDGEVHLGHSVALSADGDTALAGGRYDNGKVGAAWVFVRSGSSWIQQGAKLTAGEETGTGEFGYSVALDAEGDTALIGGPRDNGYAGAAWAFTRSGSTWTQEAEKLTGGEEDGKGWFGAGVALSANGETMLIGGPNDNAQAGAAWVFTGPPVEGHSSGEQPGGGSGSSETLGNGSPSGSSGQNPATTTTTNSGGVAGQGVLAFGPTSTAGVVTCKVLLLAKKVPVQTGGRATLKLTWKGPGTCRGRLNLTTKVRARVAKKGEKQPRSSARTIAIAAFAIPAGKASTVRIKLNAAGRSLLAAQHGRLTVTLTILQSSPGPSHTRTQTIRLARQKTHHRKR